MIGMSSEEAVDRHADHHEVAEAGIELMEVIYVAID
jgi:hypothetical protein